MASAVARRQPTRRTVAIALLAGQVLAALIAWVAAWTLLESILVTGPVLVVIGLLLAIVVRPVGRWTPLLFSLSAPAVSALGAFTIAIFHLGPTEAYRPILTILTIYLALIVPASIVVLRQIRRWPVHLIIGASRTWHYSLKSLLGLMTVVAVLTAVLTSIVRTLSDFPIFFEAFGSAAMVLAGLVAWRFYIGRQRILYLSPSPRFLTTREWLEAKVFAPFLRQTPDVRCSFCGSKHSDAGPFAEGRDGSLICGRCAEECSKLIVDKRPSVGERSGNHLTDDEQRVM